MTAFHEGDLFAVVARAQNETPKGELPSPARILESAVELGLVVVASPPDIAGHDFSDAELRALMDRVFGPDVLVNLPLSRVLNAAIRMGLVDERGKEPVPISGMPKDLADTAFSLLDIFEEYVMAGLDNGVVLRDDDPNADMRPAIPKADRDALRAFLTARPKASTDGQTGAAWADIEVAVRDQLVALYGEDMIRGVSTASRMFRDIAACAVTLVAEAFGIPYYRSGFFPRRTSNGIAVELKPSEINWFISITAADLQNRLMDALKVGKQTDEGKRPRSLDDMPPLEVSKAFQALSDDEMWDRVREVAHAAKQPPSCFYDEGGRVVGPYGRARREIERLSEIEKRAEFVLREYGNDAHKRIESSVRKAEAAHYILTGLDLE